MSMTRNGQSNSSQADNHASSHRTYTTPYLGDLLATRATENGNHVSTASSASDSDAAATSPPDDSAQTRAAQPPRRPPPGILVGSKVAWQASEQQIDRTALMARDPILFYDEVPLHVSELDDNGVSQLSVKVGSLVLVAVT